MLSPTRALAEFVAGLRSEHLPDAVVRQASDVAFRFSEAEARRLAALIRDLPGARDVRAVARALARS